MFGTQDFKEKTMTNTAEKLQEVFAPEKALVPFNEFEAQLAELKSVNSKTIFEYDTPSGNAAARSYVRKLSQTAGAIERVRKEEKAASLEYGRRVDAEAKRLDAEVRAMQEPHQKAIDEIEGREKERIN